MTKIKEGRIADSAKHRFLITARQHESGDCRFISHLMMCKMHGYGSVPNYQAFYMSLPPSALDAVKANLKTVGRSISYVGPRFGHIQVPPSLKLIEKMMPPSIYVGFDFMGVEPPLPVPLLWLLFVANVQECHNAIQVDEWGIYNGN